MMIINLSEKVTQKVFGEVINVSQPLVSDLLRRGVIKEGQSVGEWIKSYCGHLREQAAGRATDSELNLATERAALAREQRLRIEMQNAVTRKEYGPIEALEIGLADCLSKVAAQLDTIPGKLKRSSNNLTADDLNHVASTIAEVRNALATMDINWFGDKTEDNDDTILDPSSESSD